MERTRKLPESKGASPSHPRDTASRTFARRKIGDRAMVTHDSLAEDLANFRLSGGVIEVLGTTLARRSASQEGASPASDVSDERERQD